MRSASDGNVVANIVLPGKDYAVQTWKVKPGTSVRKGETVAVAILKEHLKAIQGKTAAPTNGAAASAQHKRPNRRRKIAPAAAAASAPQAAGPTTTQNDQGQQKNAATNLHQRLAEKLDQRSKQLQQPQSTSIDASSESSPNSSSDTTSTTAIETIPLLATADGILKLPQKPPQEDDRLIVVAYIEECMHPGFLEGLCVRCGASMIPSDSDNPNMLPVPSFSSNNFDDDDDKSNNITTQPKSSLVTVSGGVTMSVSESEGRQMAQRDTERLLKQKKLSLVLDLDHTLVHATADPRARHCQAHEGEVRTLRLPTSESMPNFPNQPQNQQNGGVVFMQHFAKLRPHIKQFLETVIPMYELTVYTAGVRHYAEEIAIVLCRHLVGSNRDIDELERMRYELHMAEEEYRKHHSLGENDNDGDKKQKANVDDEKSGDTKMMEMESEENKKRKSEDMETEKDNDGTAEPAYKRKKVSFGPPIDGHDSVGGGDNNESGRNDNNRSDHMTLAKLQALRQEFREAQDLEREAWEMRRKVFGSRVVSRNDVGDLGRDVKSLKRIFPCGGTMAAVIDDRADVWANAADNSVKTIRGEPPENLLLVRAYHWQPFIGFADINNAAGRNLSGNGPSNGSLDPRAETDVQLIWTSRILRGLHRRFYSQDINNRKTVPEILSMMRSEVLKGSKLVLSGLVPLQQQSMGTSNNPARPTAVRHAQSLGAKVLDNVQPGVTHVVAAKDGTDKAWAARKTPGCVLVRPTWLDECYWSMTRRDVKPHMMEKGQGPPLSSKVVSGRKQQHEPLKESKVDNSSEGSSDSDSDDDELAAMLEEEMMNG